MHRNFVYNNIDHALPRLFGALLGGGDEVGSRNGRVVEFTHVGITLTKPWQREITVRGRKANLAAQIAETMWVLSGRNDVEFLAHYLPRAKDFSDDSKTWRGGYGPRLRKWATPLREGTTLDQVAFVADLLRKDPLSRRAVISIYDPAVDSADGKDIPCNDFIVFTNRLGKLDMAVTIRSNDLMWGWSGINAFEWSVLQELVAADVGVEVGALHFNTASLHLYQQHWEKGRKLVESFPVAPVHVEDSPRLKISENLSFAELSQAWFRIESEIRNGTWRMYDIEQFPEPMMQSWLRVLCWWWTGNPSHLQPLANTRLFFAAQEGLQPPLRETTMAEDVTEEKSFIERVCDLHDEKDAAYGDSWKKRGEAFSIIPNVARKVDRLGGAETSDETSVDTAMDLFVYLAKYRTWLDDPKKSDGTRYVNELLRQTDQTAGWDLKKFDYERTTTQIKSLFDQPRDPQEFGDAGGLVQMVENDRGWKESQVDMMLRRAYYLARFLDWQAHNQGRTWKGYEA